MQINDFARIHYRLGERSRFLYSALDGIEHCSERDIYGGNRQRGCRHLFCFPFNRSFFYGKVDTESDCGASRFDLLGSDGCVKSGCAKFA